MNSTLGGRLTNGSSAGRDLASEIKRLHKKKLKKLFTVHFSLIDLSKRHRLAVVDLTLCGRNALRSRSARSTTAVHFLFG